MSDKQQQLPNTEPAKGNDKTGNLRHWAPMARPPQEALRKITGGRINGMTNISPQWRLRIMTEHFGPIGVGWKYTIDEKWTEQIGDEIMACVKVSLYIKDNDQWTEAIPGLGGSKILQKESAGLYGNDDGFKMALTDALSVAMKSIGVAADIYLGMWEESKYRDSWLDDGYDGPKALDTAAILEHTDEVAAIRMAPTLELLHKQYSELYKKYENDKPVRDLIIAAKDERKAQLQDPA